MAIIHCLQRASIYPDVMFKTTYELTLEIISIIKKLISNALLWEKLGHISLNAILFSKKRVEFKLLLECY